MAGWSIAIESGNGQQDPLWTHFPCSQQSGFTGIPGSAPARLTSRNQPLAVVNNEVAMCNTVASKPFRPGGFLAGDRFASKIGGEELLWPEPSRDPTASKWSLPGDSEPWRGARYESDLTAETVSKLCHQGFLAEAVEALGILVQTDCCSSKSLFYTVLKECVAAKDLLLGRRVHALMVKNGYQSDTFLCNHILRMYASHGKLQDAMDVFGVVAQPGAGMWAAIIAAHGKTGQGKQALQLYHQMRRSNVKADSFVFVAALQSCARGSDLETGRQVHANVLASDIEPNLFVWNCLVTMYVKCGSLGDAQDVFDGLREKNVVTWNAMIAGYSHRGMGQEALSLYRAMQENGMTVPNSVTFVFLLQACASLGTLALEKGKQLHAQIRERGHQDDPFVASSLVNMYAKCGSLEDAQIVFDGLEEKDVVTWTAMISGYSQKGMGHEALHLYSAMQAQGIAVPNSVTFVCLLQACASVGTPSLDIGKQLHAQITQGRHQADVFVASGLVHMYAKCGSLENAQSVFDGIGQKDVVTWTAMIAGYSQQGMGQEALRLYSAMQEEGIAIPNIVTFVCLLQACASVGSSALEIGKQLHAQIREQGHEADAFVASSLVNMYAKCGSLVDAQRLFDGLNGKDLVAWNAMIAGYSHQGLSQEAFRLYSVMQEAGTILPDCVTFVCLLQSCARLGTSGLEKGKQLHAQIRERGHQDDVSVASCLVNMYAKCGSLEDAQRVFDALGQKHVVTWNALIAGYSQQGMGKEALGLYSSMQEEGIAVPSTVTFVSLLQACATVGTSALEMGKQLHAKIRGQGHQGDVFVANSLINMYAKCGSLDKAQREFDGLCQKDVVSWNALIAGYSKQGMCQEALRLYSAMQEEGIAVPNPSTFICLLQACANVSALHLGRQLHAQIKEQGLQANLSVAGSLINMYGKSGSMADAQEVFDTLPTRDVVTWSALIAGYACRGDSEVVFDLIYRMREDGIKPVGITFLSVLTVCSHAGLVSKGKGYFEAMTRECGITPTVDHYTCMVDLLGRTGRLHEALALVMAMHVSPNAAIWHTLLSACRRWSNVEVGCYAFEQALKLDEKDAAAYVLMLNIYTGAQMWEQARIIQARRMRLRAWKQPGQSWWTDMDGLVHSFLVGGE